MYPVPGYRIILLDMAFDVGSGWRSNAGPHSPRPLLVLFILPRELTNWTKCVEQVGLGTRTAGCEGFSPQRKAAAKVGVWSTSLSWWQFSHSQPGRIVEQGGLVFHPGERSGCERRRWAEWEGDWDILGLELYVWCQVPLRSYVGLLRTSG